MQDCPQASLATNSILDLLTDEQMEELQDMASREDESPTVSGRLGQMMSKLAEGNEAIQAAMEEAKEAATDKFANLLATPLHQLAKDDDFNDE